MFDDYVSHEKTPLFKSSSGDPKIIHLLWGDGVRFDGARSGGRRKVKTRSHFVILPLLFGSQYQIRNDLKPCSQSSQTSACGHPERALSF